MGNSTQVHCGEIENFYQNPIAYIQKFTWEARVHRTGGKIFEKNKKNDRKRKVSILLWLAVVYGRSEYLQRESKKL